MKTIDDIYCPNCLLTIQNTNLDSFCCDNEFCSCRYSFEVFLNEKEAIVFFDNQESWKPKYLFQRADYYLVCFYNSPVKTLKIFKLSDLISKESLRLIELGISADNVTSITIIESDGNRIDNLDGNKLNVFCSEYCKLIRTLEAGDLKCEEFDKRKLVEVLENKYARNWYYCWAGLIDYFSIINVNGIILGIIVAGQLKDNSENGRNILNQSIDYVSNTLGIDKEKLLEKSKNSKKVSNINEIENEYILNLNSIANIISEIADKSFKVHKKLNEDLFLEEISYYIDYSNKGYKNLDSISHVLKRFEEYYNFESVYFLLSNNKHKDPYKIYSSSHTKSQCLIDKDINISFEENKKTALESVSICQVNDIPNSKIINEISILLPNTDKRIIYLATCPLIGVNQGVFIFINPKLMDGFRNSLLLSDLERDFIRRFCVTIRDKLNNNLSFGIVLNRIGHELGNSVQALISNEDAIIDVYDNANEVKELSKRNINELIKHAHFIFNLKSSLSKSNRNSYIVRRSSIKDLLADIIEILDMDSNARNITFNQTMQSPHFIEMDKEELGRAFYNLVQNAIKYSFDNRFIKIAGKEDKDNNVYKVSISNFGVGITEEELNLGLIFNEGYRGKLSIDRNRTGSGLGLAISKEIIENHNGSIEVYSSNNLKDNNEIDYYINNIESDIIENGTLKLGYYTTFTISLPFIQTHLKF